MEKRKLITIIARIPNPDPTENEDSPLSVLVFATTPNQIRWDWAEHANDTCWLCLDKVFADRLILAIYLSDGEILSVVSNEEPLILLPGQDEFNNNLSPTTARGPAGYLEL